MTFSKGQDRHTASVITSNLSTNGELQDILDNLTRDFSTNIELSDELGEFKRCFLLNGQVKLAHIAFMLLDTTYTIPVAKKCGGWLLPACATWLELEPLTENLAERIFTALSILLPRAPFLKKYSLIST